MDRVEAIATKTPGVAHTIGVARLLGPDQHQRLERRRDVCDPRAVRRAKARPGTRAADAIADQIRGQLAGEITTALVAVFGAPPVDGLGSTGGFKLRSRTAATRGRSTAGGGRRR